jgi:hypothetical protein
MLFDGFKISPFLSVIVNDPSISRAISLNVGRDGRPAVLFLETVGFAVQVEQPT